MQDNFFKEFWISTGMVAGSFALTAGLLVWLTGDVHAHSESIGQSRLLLEQRARSIEVLAKLKYNDKEVESYNKQMNQLLPTQEELFDFNRRLDEVARINQVSLTVQPGITNMPAGGQPGAFGFSFQVQGPFENLTNFFKELEQKSTKFLVSVDTLDVQFADPNYRVISQGRVFFD